MKLESIERLRGLATDVNKSEIKDHDALYSLDQWLNAWHRAFGKALEALEREIAEKYMELPVDRDGEPWRIGDKFPLRGADGKKHICTVSGLSADEVFFYYDEHQDSTKHRHFRAGVLTHAKPDKLKERVRKFIHDRRDLNLKDPQEKADRMLDEFCADIREMAKDGDL